MGRRTPNIKSAILMLGIHASPRMRRLAAVPFRDPAEWSLSLQIKHMLCKRLICPPIHGRVDDFLRSHQLSV